MFVWGIIILKVNDDWQTTSAYTHWWDMCQLIISRRDMVCKVWHSLLTDVITKLTTSKQICFLFFLSIQIFNVREMQQFVEKSISLTNTHNNNAWLGKLYMVEWNHQKIFPSAFRLDVFHRIKPPGASLRAEEPPPSLPTTTTTSSSTNMKIKCNYRIRNTQE